MDNCAKAFISDGGHIQKNTVFYRYSVTCMQSAKFCYSVDLDQQSDLRLCSLNWSKCRYFKVNYGK